MNLNDCKSNAAATLPRSASATRITDSLEIEELGRELYQVAAEYSHGKLVLNFSRSSSSPCGSWAS